MNNTKKFFKRLEEELDIKIPTDTYMVVTHAGRHQKSAGAWTSYVQSETDPIFQLGLTEPISSLLKCPKLALYNGRFGDEIMCGCVGKCKGIYENKKAN